MESHTPAQPSSLARARALSILHPIHAQEAEVFAHYMWPLSPSWQRPNPGRGIRRKAESFLARLRRDGLVEARDGQSGPPSYVLTAEGARATGAG